MSVKETTEDRKLTIEHCRKVLEKGGEHYSDEQIIEIRDSLYRIAYIAYEIFTEQYLPKLRAEENKPKFCAQSDFKVTSARKSKKRQK